MEKSNIKSMQLNECIKKLRFYHGLLETKYIILFTPLTFSYSSELHASLRRNSGSSGSKFVNNFSNISIFSKFETNSRILQKGQSLHFVKFLSLRLFGQYDIFRFPSSSNLSIFRIFQILSKARQLFDS